MKSGIYYITNTSNKKVYIGSSKNVFKRWTTHKSKLNKNTHSNKKLQYAWNKYGELSFKFEFIEIVEIDKLIIREQYYLDNILFANEDNSKFDDNGYNLLRVSNSSIGYSFSEESKAKMSQSKVKISKPIYIPSDSDIENIIFYIDTQIDMKDKENPFYGKTHTNEFKKKMSDLKKGKNNFFYGKGPMNGKKMSDKAKKKISIANSGRNNKNSKPIIQYDIDGVFIKEWESSGQAAKILIISQGNINGCCNGRRRTASGYIWKFK